jgi:hypothetical protein
MVYIVVKKDKSQRGGLKAYVGRVGHAIRAPAVQIGAVGDASEALDRLNKVWLLRSPIHRVWKCDLNWSTRAMISVDPIGAFSSLLLIGTRPGLRLTV